VNNGLSLEFTQNLETTAMNQEVQQFFQAVGEDFHDILDVSRVAHVTVRLLIAALLGGLLGYQRERVGKSAGIRTHMLVTAGTALFVIVPQLEGATPGDMTRVVQGIVTGIGFLGGGTILKLTDAHQIKGLTTAAGIWLAAAIGIAVGFGRIGTALIGTLLAFAILGLVFRLEAILLGKRHDESPDDDDAA
jgi:putative Mg2+ transporter-C (MgtC) family protein